MLAIQGLEPWTFALLARRSNQLSYTATDGKCVTTVLSCMQLNVEYRLKKVVLAIQGLEPWTFALLARRSNQLSYTATDGKCVTALLSSMQLHVSWGKKMKKSSAGQCGGRTHDIRVISTTL